MYDSTKLQILQRLEWWGTSLCFPPSSETQGQIVGARESLTFWLLIGAKKTQVFWHQSEATTAATVWNWSGKTLSPRALLADLYFSFVPYFSACLDFPLPPVSAPRSPRMAFHYTCTSICMIWQLCMNVIAHCWHITFPTWQVYKF